MKNELVSADEAVARLLNVDFIPAESNLLGVLDDFVVKAQARYDAAIAGRGQARFIISQRSAVDICERRLGMAQYILLALEEQAQNNLLIATDGKSRTQMFNWEAVQEWARENYGLVVPDSVVIVESTPLPISVQKPETEGSTGKFEKFVGDGVSKTKAKNLLVTLYALAKTHADRHQSTLIKKTSGGLVFDAVAKEIVEIVSKLSGQQQITGQGTEAIKDRLEAAEEAWQRRSD